LGSFPSKPSLLQAEQSQLSAPFFTGEMLQSLYHLLPPFIRLPPGKMGTIFLVETAVTGRGVMVLN